ncbi:unnamed protein product [Staurois parvus]|uniref:Uncharacterized protein n=1 Tax=Staurois parvus TaxID=386267 RepID=A0ABN9DQ09_9NEOB|nr:unnamed protein product [Staurois parvus]
MWPQKCHLSVSISATCQCPSMTHQCIPVHINATYQCPSELPFNVTHQCQSVPPIMPISETYQCLLISATYQCPSVQPISAHHCSLISAHQ